MACLLGAGGQLSSRGPKIVGRFLLHPSAAKHMFFSGLPVGRPRQARKCNEDFDGLFEKVCSRQRETTTCFQKLCFASTKLIILRLCCGPRLTRERSRAHKRRADSSQGPGPRLTRGGPTHRLNSPSPMKMRAKKVSCQKQIL